MLLPVFVNILLQIESNPIQIIIINNQLYLERVTHNSNSTDELVALHPKIINKNTINIPKSSYGQLKITMSDKKCW